MFQRPLYRHLNYSLVSSQWSQFGRRECQSSWKIIQVKPSKLSFSGYLSYLLATSRVISLIGHFQLLMSFEHRARIDNGSMIETYLNVFNILFLKNTV